MKKPLQILVLVVVAFLALGFIKNSIAQSIVTGALSGVAHVPVRIGSMNVGFLSASIRIKDLRVYNPSGFPDKLMLNVPQIFIDFEPGALFKGQAHFKEVKLDLKEVIVVRDKTGHLNVDAVKPTQTQRDQAQKQEKQKQAGAESKPTKLLIDKLSLSVGRVTYKDYSGGGEPAIQTFDVNIQNREYTHIEDPAAVVSLIMFEALTRTALSGLSDLDLHAFKEGGLNALSQTLGVAGNSKEVVQSAAKKLATLFN